MARLPHPDEDLGQPLPYDPDFHGPLKNRSCTDILCLLLFLVFIGCWAGLGWYAISYGDPRTLLLPKDSSGSRCGIDSHVINKPYLFFFDLTRCLSPEVPITGCPTQQVCVESCPQNFYIEGQIDDPNYTNYCTYDGNDCPKWYLPSQSFQKRCIPELSALNNATMIEKIKEYLNYQNDLFADLTKSISNIKLFSQAEKVGQNIVEDIMVSWWKILIGVLMALVACIIYILILRWIAAFMVWLSICGVVVALTAGLYFTTTQYIKKKKEFSTALLEEQSGIKTQRDLWLAGLVIISIILGIILLMLIFLRKRIILAIALVKEGSKAVSSVTSVLFFPVLPWILQVGVISYAICLGLYLSTTGEAIYQTRHITDECSAIINMQNGTECDPNTFNNTIIENNAASTCLEASCKFIMMQNDQFYPYMQVFNVFGFFWLAFFVSALGQMILASVFAQWYWTFHKRDLPFFAVTEASLRTVRYHLGTLAFGSLIIAICRMIRVCLEYLDQKLKKYDNDLVKAILCCLKCFFWCLEKFLKFINKNAYIMCAIHGHNFCASAKDAFMLLMRNILRVFVLDKVTDFLFFLSKLLVTMGVGATAYVVFATDVVSFVDNSGLKYPAVPVAIIMIATFLISSLFFSVYSMAVDTLFLCFLEDCERNDGSAEKPYYMSKNLMKIFGKKNKSS